MNVLTDTLLRVATHSVRIHAGDVSNYTPGDIRQSIAELVSQGNLPLAEALTEAGLSIYPLSEEILAIAALLAEVRQDWGTASQLLRQLVQVQGEHNTPSTTWIHLVRVLRCMCEPQQALEAVQSALKHHPNDSVLQNEKAELDSLFDTVSDIHMARDAA